jgi:hypothetical protein
LANACGEAIVLGRLSLHFLPVLSGREAGNESGSRTNAQKMILEFYYNTLATLWIRMGVVVSIICKLTGAMDTRYLKVVHMAFITTGFAYYYRKDLRVAVVAISARRISVAPAANQEERLETDFSTVMPSASTGISSTSHL